MADQVFTREGLINQIAEDIDGEGAVAEFADAKPEAQPETKEAPKVEENLEAQVDPDIQSIEDIVKESQPETKEEVKEEVQPETKEPLSLKHIYEAVEDEVKAQPSMTKEDIKAIVKEAIEPYVEDSTTETKEETAEKTYQNMTPEQIQQIVQKSLQQHESTKQQTAQVEAATNREIENYESTLYASLEKSGVNPENDPILDAYIKDTFEAMLDKVANKLGTVYPGDIKEIAKVHSRKIEQIVNKRRPDYVPPQAKTPSVQAGTTATPTTVAPTRPKVSADKLDQQAIELAKKSGGKLPPSLASAYVRGKMKSGGSKEIKF
jgi:(2Fe-2S) ferredoxin